MKIDTLEKLEILMLGLNAGRDLEIMHLGGKKSNPIFSDGERMGFHLAEDGTVTTEIGIDSEEYPELYTMMGCIAHAENEARIMFALIKPNAGENVIIDK